MSVNHPGRRIVGGVAAVLALAGAAGGWWYWSTRASGAPGHTGHAAGEATDRGHPVTVDVTTPRPGGIERVVVQPGSIEALDIAPLYAKVTGRLAEQSVDIGSRVSAGQVLARVSVPEFDRQVERDKAKIEQAKARVNQMAAHITAAEAEARAADSAILLARVTVKAKTAYRDYREKQLARIKQLSAQEAIEGRIRDEQEDYYSSAFEAENAAREAVNVAQERAAAAKAKIVQARADLAEAQAEVGVATATWEQSKVWQDYCVVTSPITGVVTHREFTPGGFIRAAESGGSGKPMLVVERTDVLRGVVQVPDRDVPYVSIGDPVTLEIDAFNGRETYAGTVTRFAHAEDPATRLMRTEFDIPNPTGEIRRGMYGMAKVIVAAANPKAVRVPSAAVARSAGGKATVRVVRDGKIGTVPVTLGADNGIDVEVTTGLTPADRVVVRAAGSVDDGTAVQAHDVSADQPAEGGGHH